MKTRIASAILVSYFWLLVCWCSGSGSFASGSSQLGSNSLENSPISHLDATVGGEVLLPCDLTPANYGDASILVLFFRGENKTPIYSVDSRGSSLKHNGKHWSAKRLGGRAVMETQTTLAKDTGLKLRDVRLDDAGLYRCRVDFESSPTKNSRVQLRVIEPPQRINVVSTWEGERKTTDIIGPYPVGSEITLSCQVIGGIPPPRVTWWQEGSLLDDVSEVKSGGIMRNTLHLSRLTRSDLLKVVTCQAVNSNLTSPLTKAVTIDLAYPPSSIRISSAHDEEFPSNNDVAIPGTVTCITGQKCPLECKVDGTRPPPLVTWKSNGRTLESEFETISSPPGAKKSSQNEDKSFYSTLMLEAKRDDNGAMISCRASSPALPTNAVEDTVKLNVLYKPELKLEVMDRLDLRNVEEGEDVEFECQVDANPEVVEIQWTRNWIPLVRNTSGGIYISEGGSSMTLRRVDRHASGHYACAAANSRGSGTSNVIQLSIKFSPKCSSKQVSSIGVGKSESANVTCRVEAHPMATIFRWAFNSSNELVDIPFDHQIEKNDSSNTITYQPSSPFDFGDLLCWASNTVGTMKRPCVIKILPIDKPEGVRGCRVSSNGTSSEGVITVSCLPGWDGGLTQTFTLEVRKAAHVHARILAALKHSSDPIFHLRNLQPGQEYLFTITSANPRGTSPPVTLSYTIPEEVIAGLTNKHSNPKSPFMTYLPFLAVFIAVVVVLTTCGSVIACVAKSRAAEKAKLRKDIDRKLSVETRKASVQNSLPPDRGKDDLEDDDLTVKDPSEHYCAVHGHERRENEYISYKHYFNNMRDDTETQHLLKSSIGGSSGVETNGSTSRDSSSSCGMDRQGYKEVVPEFPCDARGNIPQQRYSEGSFRGLAPLASVDSLSGFSTISNHSSGSKKTESSSQKSYRAIPEGGSSDEYVRSVNGFLPRPLNATLPSIKITPFPSVLHHQYSPKSDPKADTPSSPPFHTPKKIYQPNFSYPSSINPHYSPIYSAYHTPADIPRSPSPASSSSPNHSTYGAGSIPSLPPPSISTHPVFLSEALKSGQYCSGENTPPSWECLNQERKLSRESSV